MIKSVILASYSYFEGGLIGDMLTKWEQMGFFSYLLPFLLIFALVFGILTQIRLFKDNKAINGIIALVVGLMALQFPIVPQFFSEIFPRLGVGLAILLIILILAGMFIDTSKAGMMVTLMVIGLIIAVIIFIQTAGAVGWSSGYWWQENWPEMVGIIFLLVIVGLIIGSSQPTKEWKALWPGVEKSS